MDYLIWKAIIEDGCCVCGSLENVEDSHKVKRGISVAEYFPDNAFFQMSPDFPKDIKLVDNIRNRGGFVLVSRGIKNMIEGANNVNHVEYLPVKIINHKGRIASKDYFIINPLDICDAIDFDQSEIKWNNINPDIISSCAKLVLKKNNIPYDFKIFRLKYFPRRVLLRRDLAEKIGKGGFTGIAFTESQNFRGF